MIPPLGADTTGIHTMKYSEIFLWLNTDVLAEGESYGWLIRRGDDAGGRYRLSFTVGGLLSPQGRAFAEMYLNRMGGGSTERSSQTKISEKISEKANEKSDKNAGEEVCESIAAIRQQAIEENVLAIRTDPRTGVSWRKLLGGSVRSRLGSFHIWQARIPPHPTARHLCGSRCAVITQSSGNSPAKYLKSIILPAIRIWTLRIMIGSLRTKPHGILSWKT